MFDITVINKRIIATRAHYSITLIVAWECKREWPKCEMRKNRCEMQRDIVAKSTWIK